MVCREHKLPIERQCDLRIMREMGLRAIYPGPKTTIVNKENYKYAYLLRNLVIDGANKVWQVDITYFAQNMDLYI